MRHLLLIAGFLVVPLGTAPFVAEAAEKECERWLKLVDGEVRELKEMLNKKSDAERTRIQEMVTRTGARVAEARKACHSGNDKAATLMALDLWDAFVERERQEGTLSLNSRLNSLALRIDRLKAFRQRGWRAKMSDDVERQFLAELDRLDRALADALKQSLR